MQNQLNDVQIKAWESAPMTTDQLERSLAVLAPGGQQAINVGDFCRGLQVFGKPFAMDEVVSHHCTDQPPPY